MTVKGDAGCVCSVCVCVGGILQATQWAGWPGGEEPDAFRNCTCGLKIWWESCLPVQAFNEGSRTQNGERRLEWHSGTLSGDRATLESW